MAHPIIAGLVLAAGLTFARPPAAAGGQHPDGSPRRVVSMNLCADQLVVLLVDGARIASVSHLALDPALSYVAARATGLPLNHGTAEEILPLRPDLVIGGSHTALHTATLLKAKGVPVVQLAIPRDFAEIRAQLRFVARHLDAEDRAEALIADMDRRLNRPADAAAPRPLALAWQAGGFTAGAGTLTDAVLAAAGLENMAARAGITGYGYLTLETVVAGHPDLLIADAALPDRPSAGQALLHHPALAAPGAVGARAELPPALWACGGPFTVEAVERLRQAVRR